MKRHLLLCTALLLITGVASRMHAQSLDDGWSPLFGFPGFEGTIIAIAEDDRGGYYALEQGGLHWGPHGVQLGLHHWNGLAWSSQSVPLDTLDMNGATVVPRDRWSRAYMLEQGSGDLLLFGSVLGTGKNMLLRFDRDLEIWREFESPLPEFSGFPVRGEDGLLYTVAHDTVDGVAGPTIMKLSGNRWERIFHASISDLGEENRLLGITSDGVPYFNRRGTHPAEAGEVPISWDSLSWVKEGGLHSLEFRSERSDVEDFDVVGENAYLLRSTWDPVENSRRKENELLQVVKVTSEGYVAVSEPLDEEIRVLRDNSGQVSTVLTVRGEAEFYMPTDRGILSWNGTSWKEEASGYLPFRLYMTGGGELLSYEGYSEDPAFNQNNVTRFDLDGRVWVSLSDAVLSPGGVRSHGGGISFDRDESLLHPSALGYSGDGAVSGDILRLREGEWEVEASGLRQVSRDPAFVSYVLPHPEKGYYVGGDFDSAGSILAKDVAWWDGEEWHPLGDTVLYNTRFGLTHMAIHDGELYTVGLHTAALDPERSGMKTIFAKWDGSVWEILSDSALINGARLFFDEGEIYCAGSFSGADYTPHWPIAKWTGKGWEAMNSAYGIQRSRVWDITREGDDLYAAGEFTTMGETDAYSIARWDGERWFALDSGVTRASDARDLVYGELAEINSISASDRYLVVGGSLLHAGTTLYASPRRVDLGCGVAFWDKREETWNRLGSGLCSPLGTEGVAEKVKVRGDTVWVSGDFDFAGGKRSLNIARYIIPPAKISTPEVPGLLDFGEVRVGETVMAYLRVTNPESSTRTVRGEVSEPEGPFSITFDGVYQGSVGQTSLLPVYFTPSRTGQFEDTVMVSHNGVGPSLPVILRGNSSTTSVEGEGDSRGGLALQVGPNPVVSEARISFALSRGSDVRVAIYSLDGREVAVLADEPMESGEQVLTWDAGALPRGSYICQLSWSGGESVRRVVLR